MEFDGEMVSREGCQRGETDCREFRVRGERQLAESGDKWADSEQREETDGQTESRERRQMDRQ